LAVGDLGAVTIDLDGVRHYHAIHGLPAPEGPDLMLRHATRRFLELCDRVGVLGTLFVVAQDLEDPEFASLLRDAHQAGHEIASHSLTHDYRMTTWTLPAMKADLAAARDAIHAAVGQAPAGFRAPGYNMNQALMQAVVETGHSYDSSVLPSGPYYVARSLAIARYALTRKPSRSLRGDPRQFAGPRQPYRPSHKDWLTPARDAGQGVWELPMAVVGPLSLPVIGTFMTLYPKPLERLVTAWRTRAGGPFNLELHAVDLAGPEDGVGEGVLRAQPDLQVPLDQRLNGFERLLDRMASRLEVLPLRGWLDRL